MVVHTVSSSILFSHLCNGISVSEAVNSFQSLASLRYLIPGFHAPHTHQWCGWRITSNISYSHFLHTDRFLSPWMQFAMRGTPFTIIHIIRTIELQNLHCDNQRNSSSTYVRRRVSFAQCFLAYGYFRSLHTKSSAELDPYTSQYDRRCLQSHFACSLIDTLFRLIQNDHFYSHRGSMLLSEKARPKHQDLCSSFITVMKTFLYANVDIDGLFQYLSVVCTEWAYLA